MAPKQSLLAAASDENQNNGCRLPDREHPAQHHRAGVHTLHTSGQKQRDADVRSKPTCRREESQHPRPAAGPSEDHRGRRRASQDPGGEEELKPRLLVIRGI